MSKNRHSGQSQPSVFCAPSRKHSSNRHVIRKQRTPVVSQRTAPPVAPKVIEPVAVQVIKLADCPQPEQLKKVMQRVELTHGKTIVADLSNVRVGHEGNLYFCPIKGIEIRESISEGDGAEIPEKVTLCGDFVILDFMPGYFNLKNIELTSNGTIQVIARPETIWEKVVPLSVQ